MHAGNVFTLSSYYDSLERLKLSYFIRQVNGLERPADQHPNHCPPPPLPLTPYLPHKVLIVNMGIIATFINPIQHIIYIIVPEIINTLITVNRRLMLKIN